MDKNTIIKLLQDAYDAAGIEMLCYKNVEFEKEHGNIESLSTKDKKIIELLKFCEQNLLIERLLEVVKEERPAMYQKYKDESDASKQDLSPIKVLKLSLCQRIFYRLLPLNRWGEKSPYKFLNQTSKAQRDNLKKYVQPSKFEVDAQANKEAIEKAKDLSHKIIKAVQYHNFTFLLGESGVGKTMLMQKTFQQYARTCPEESLVFVYADNNTSQAIDQVIKYTNKNTILWIDGLDEDRSLLVDTKKIGELFAKLVDASHITTIVSMREQFWKDNETSIKVGEKKPKPFLHWINFLKKMLKTILTKLLLIKRREKEPDKYSKKTYKITKNKLFFYVLCY